MSSACSNTALLADKESTNPSASPRVGLGGKGKSGVGGKQGVEVGVGGGDGSEGVAVGVGLGGAEERGGADW